VKWMRRESRQGARGGRGTVTGGQGAYFLQPRSAASRQPAAGGPHLDGGSGVSWISVQGRERCGLQNTAEGGVLAV
jgi:hypothetical protein